MLYSLQLTFLKRKEGGTERKAHRNWWAISLGDKDGLMSRRENYTVVHFSLL